MGRFYYDLKTELLKKFDAFNPYILKALEEDLQEKADIFCEEKGLPEIEVSVSKIRKGFAVPAWRGDKIKMNRSDLVYKRDTIDYALNHELRHHEFYNDSILMKYFYPGQSYPISIFLMLMGYLLKNDIVYSLGALGWSTIFVSEIYSELPLKRRKYYLFLAGVGSIPWIPKILKLLMLNIKTIK